MKYMFKFPDIGEGLEEGKIIEWYVAKGQSISSGDALVKMETDKVVTDIPSPKSGVIAAIYGAVGETVKVGSVLVEIDIEGIQGEAAQQIAQEKPQAAKNEIVEEKGFGVVGTIEVAGDGAYLPSSGEGITAKIEPATSQTRKVLATPVARAMAKERGIEINDVKGSGPAGRVTIKDIERYQASSKYETAALGSPSPKTRESGSLYEIKPLSQIRKTIAKNMLRSKQQAAHMSVMDEVEISELVNMRLQLKDEYSSKGMSISYLPFVIKAITLALKAYPILNAELDLEAGNIIYKHFYNIGIAVDTPEGLVVPVIRNADQKSIVELATELNQMAEKAKERKLSLEDMKDGTFTVTSYGSIGGYFAVPVINYPQVAIFGIGKLSEKPVVKNSEIVLGKVLPISMSIDHRIVDGGDVARFLNLVLDYLQHPIKMLVM
ncbi:MAG: dihydrolipoamide acetyltransferase family protein [Candidatus Cloacimonadaceae bacterium]|nr:dihydrolipoamide acetyltransferase family protein [Candidatus Cloacimonadaceae bacterium]